MLKCLIALTSLLCAAEVAAQVWTWVDENGHRHYSDRPVEGAVQIEIARPQTFSNPVPGASAAAAPSETEAADESYTIFEILSPTDEEVLFNIAGTLSVQLAIFPTLRAGHAIDLMLDGEYLEVRSRDLTVTLNEVFRGQHTVQAVVVDAAGEELTRTMPLTFHVRQNSTLTPPPQQAPAPRPPPPRPGNN